MQIQTVGFLVRLWVLLGAVFAQSSCIMPQGSAQQGMEARAKVAAMEQANRQRLVLNAKELRVDAGIKVSNVASLSTPGVTSYKGYGNAFLIYDIGQSYLVGQIRGGPYTCDLNNPSATGTGTAISLRWSDNYFEPILPAPNYDCVDLVWQR